VPRGSLKKNVFKGIIKTFWVEISQNGVFKVINFFIYANLELPFYLKKGFLGEFSIKVDIFDGSITAQWAKIG